MKKINTWFMSGKWVFGYALFSLAWMLFPEMAQAADGFFVLDPGDKSKELVLDVLFPGEGSENSPLSEAIRAFNSGVLLLGGILAAYSMVVGTVNTAHDGEMLGKKWSSMWLPVRTVLGTSAIIPMANGFCLVQVIVIWLIGQGAGFANVVWTGFTSNIANTSITMPGASTEKLKAIATRMYESNLCVEFMNDGAFRSQSAQTFFNDHGSFKGARPFSHSFVKLDGKNDTTYGIIPTKKYSEAYVYVPKMVGEEGNCGEVLLDYGEKVLTGQQSDSTNLDLNDGLSGAMQDIIRHSAQVARNAYSEKIAVLNTEMKQLASEVWKSRDASIADTIIYQKVSKISREMKEIMSSSASTSLAEHEGDIMAKAQQDGWLFAGGFFVTLSRIQDAFAQVLNSPPTLSGKASNEALEGLGMDEEFRNFFDEINKNKKQAARLKEVGDPSCDWVSLETAKQLGLNCFARQIISSISQGGIGIGSGENNPIMAAKSFGDTLIISAQSVVLAAAVAKSIAAGTEKAAGATPLFGSIAAGVAGTLKSLLSDTTIVFFMAAVPFMVFGATLAVIIPFLPYTIWMGVVFAWLLLIVEAVIAAPLWAVMHIHPDGDDVAGKGANGYMLIVGLTLRPVLMILGLISALIVMPILGNILNMTFNSVFTMNQEGATTGIVTILAVISVYVGLMTAMIKKSCALIHTIPDEVLRWMGGHAPQLGQAAEEMNRAAGEHHNTVVAGIGGGIGRTKQGLNAAKEKGEAQAEKDRSKGQSSTDRSAAASSAFAGNVGKFASASTPAEKNAIATAQMKQYQSDGLNPSMADVIKSLDDGVQLNG